MHVADAGFEPCESFGGGAVVDVEAEEFAESALRFSSGEVAGEHGVPGSWRRDEACAENEAVVFEGAAPEIGEIDGVEGVAAGEAGGAELGGSERGGG